ncbi:hypothetical protein ACFE04_015548 [Oxalis oulophora]
MTLFHKPTTVSFYCCAPDAPPISPSRRQSVNPLRQPPPLHRAWVHAPYNPITSQDKFTVASYNILGDFNAWKHRDLYPDVPLMYMKWAHRKKLICEELIELNPDIICMQEVDKYLDLSNELEKAGYDGIYKRRTGDRADGCATFWKSDKFRMLEGRSIEFEELSLRDNVAQLSVFETCSGESRRLVVGNIHVIFRPSKGEVKLGQLRLLSSRAQILSEKWGDAPLVLGGDFNSTPQSAVYQFLSSSELNIESYNRKELSGQRSCHPSQVLGYKNKTSSTFSLMDRFFENGWTDEHVKLATGNSKSYLAIHPLKLNSSYATIKGSEATRDSSGEPLATSYHAKFLGTVDYLWYSDGLAPTRVLDTLPINALRTTGGLPCKIIGSDHLALVCEFAFTKGQNKDNTSTFSAISDTEAEQPLPGDNN